MIVLNKENNAKIGITLTIIGVIFFALAFYTYSNPYKSIDLSLTKKEAITQCAAIFKKNGFEVEARIKEGEISIIKNGLDTWLTDIVDISLSSDSCKSMEMTSFCMGSSCKKEENRTLIGTSTTLDYIEPVKKEIVK